MWCRQCQQDVPAVARSSVGPLVCPRCRGELHTLSNVAVSDAGIDLESLDDSASVATERDPLRAPVDELIQQESRRRMRRIGRQLHSPYSVANPTAPSPALERMLSPTVCNPSPAPALRQLSKQAQREAPAASSRPSVVLSLVLAGGICGFVLGLFVLLWSVAFGLSTVWQWGLTTILASEGLLTLGLVWMAARLWNNGRKVNRRLANMDQQLGEIHDLAGSLSADRLSSSQFYYHHFSQVASPHMLVANLRGQVDLLADRLAG